MREIHKTKVVFVAGAVHSGSTLLGSLIGSAEKAFYAGEIKQYARRLTKDVPNLRQCTCGSSYEECTFWRQVQVRVPADRDLNPRPGFSGRNLKLMLRLLVPFGWRHRSTETTDYGAIVEAIHAVAKQRHPSVEYVVDTSRSIHHLDQAARSDNLDLYVIHIVRDGLSVVNSIKARGYSVFRGIATWWLANAFLDLYLARTGIQRIRVEYRLLCEEPALVLTRLNGWLGTDIHLDGIVERVNETDYHLMSGNRGVRRVLSISGGFRGIRHQTQLDHLGPFDRLLTQLLLTPFQNIILRHSSIEPNS
jgi:hypothetical protein